MMNLDMMTTVMNRLKKPDAPRPIPDAQRDINAIAVEQQLFKAVEIVVEASVKTITRYVNQVAMSRMLTDNDVNIRSVIIETIQRITQDWEEIK